ncbi:membrane protein [Luteitalea sp. TBR-22]|nr:membrane protein [Luteitalea sp. TBR-22]
MPAPTLPLAYFGLAHVALGLAAGVLALWPDLPGAFHFHPRMVAVLHLVTLGWISASILGAFYIVAPLAFGMPFAVGLADHVAFGAFWSGVAAMIGGFWLGRYDVVGMGAVGVVGAIAYVGARAIRGLRVARLPAGVALHIVLAFLNMVGAGAFGLWVALARASGTLAMSPLAVAAAHAHLAVLGWGVMMVIGVSYRLVPMFLPAAMPDSPRLAYSAIGLECGTLWIAGALLAGAPTWPGALLVLLGLAAFVREVRGVLAHRRPRPAEMAGRDWATWQTHAAMAWLGVAIVAGGVGLVRGMSPGLAWVYGLAGVLGFLAQMVVGIQGRLLPLHAWYRAMHALGGQPPSRSSHRLARPAFTLGILLAWLAALPLLAVGLVQGQPVVIRLGALILALSVVAQAVHMALIARAALVDLD